MDTNPPKHFMIIAGEASGDMHAAHLVDEIKKMNPNVTFSGLGGQRMKASGVIIHEDLTRFAVIGFVEVIKHYPTFKKLFNSMLTRATEEHVDAVILVDYPGFNLRLAKKLKSRGIKVIYYISPQVWAWKENRVKVIKSFTDRMLVLFDFEKKFYAKHGLDVDCVGHPLVDTIKITRTKEETLRSLGLSSEKLTIGILPGSREKEIERLLPVMLQTASLLSQEYSHLQFLLIKAPTIPQETLQRYVAQTSIHIKIFNDETYDGINACNICMVASGTATLETAILKKPMVVIYKTAFLTWILAKLLVKIPHIGLVNVVAGKKIVPECIQFHATPKGIARELKNIFTDEINIAKIRLELEKVKEILGASGASQRAAQRILELTA